MTALLLAQRVGFAGAPPPRFDARLCPPAAPPPAGDAYPHAPPLGAYAGGFGGDAAAAGGADVDVDDHEAKKLRKRAAKRAAEAGGAGLPPPQQQQQPAASCPACSACNSCCAPCAVCPAPLPALPAPPAAPCLPAVAAAGGGGANAESCAALWRTEAAGSTSAVAPMEIHLPAWLFEKHAPPPPFTSPPGDLNGASKAQDKEDVYAVEHFFWGKREGLVLEFGAWDGVGFSNTYMLARTLGWRAVHIEASPASYTALAVNRPDALNIHAAICDRTRTVHWLDHREGRSEADRVMLGAVDGIPEFMAPAFIREFWPAFDASKLDTLPTIACRPLMPLLRLFGIGKVDFWVLDVEGGELLVLEAVDFSSPPADVIVIEADGRNAEKDAGVVAFLLAHGYDFHAHVQRNDWFVRKGFTPAVRR